MTRHDVAISPALVETIAGLTAGSVATLTVHPLDIVKTRMQSMSLPAQAAPPRPSSPTTLTPSQYTVAKAPPLQL